MIYLLDTNVIADILRGSTMVVHHFDTAIENGEALGLCPLVHYEVVRGLLRTDTRRQLERYSTEIAGALDWIQLSRADWEEAARLWAVTRSQGRQLSGTDLLLAAIAIRLEAVIVSADEDFQTLLVNRANWRIAP